MLKGIPNILPPELLKILMEMGHGDEIVIADGNFPAASHAQRLVRCDGHGASQLLDAILKLFPLDTFVKHPVALMAVVAGDNYTPDIWPAYEKIIKQHDAHFTASRPWNATRFTNGRDGPMPSLPPVKWPVTPTSF